MRSPIAVSRTFRSACAWLLVGVLWPSTASHGETVLLDAEVGKTPLVLEVYGAEVHVFIDPAGENFVQAIDPAAEPRVDGASLRTSRHGGALHVTRSVGEGEAPPQGPPDLRFDVVLAPGTPLTVRGRDLSILLEDTAYVRRGAGDTDTAESPSEDEPATVMQAEASAAAAESHQDIVLRLEVESSEVEAWGVADLAVAIEGGHLRLEGTRGRLLLEPTDSTASVIRHRGSLAVNGQGGELLLDDGRGKLEMDFQGGEVSIDGGEGTLKAHLNGTALTFDRWRGDITVEGDQSAVHGREGRSSGQGLIVRGKFLDVRVDSWRGKLTMFLDGGQVSGGPWRGKSAVTARQGATVDLEPLFGQLQLWLRSDATARLEGITGLLKVDLENSNLDLAGTTRNLEFEAAGSTATLRGAEHIRRLRATGSRVSVDLSQLKSSRPTIEALADSQVRVDALAPCLVDINAPSAIESLDLDISGCEYKRLGVGRRQRAPTRTDGSPMTRLVVRLSEDSSIDVEGH